jgi:hypothetical protein
VAAAGTAGTSTSPSAGPVLVKGTAPRR